VAIALGPSWQGVEHGLARMWGHTWQITLGMAVIYLMGPASFVRLDTTRTICDAGCLDVFWYVHGAVTIVVVGVFGACCIAAQISRISQLQD